MATIEHVMFNGGPLDGEVRDGVFGERIYLNPSLELTQPPLMDGDGVQNMRRLTHRYRRSLPTYEFDYEGFD